MTINKIRKPAELSRSQVRSLPLDHPGLGDLLGGCVAGAGTDERVPNSRWGEETRGTHLLFYVANGCVTLDSCSLTANANELLCVPSGWDKFLSTGENGAVGTWVHMQNRGAWAIFEGAAPSVSATPYAGLLVEIMGAMLLECVSPSPQSVEAVPQLSRLFATYLLRQVPLAESKDVELMEKLGRLWNEVAGALDASWSVAELSRRMNMSASHFHREVTRVQGRKPMEIVKGLRMEHACTLLRTTPLGLDVIAERIGYSTAYTFSHAFLKHVGVRPGAYRRGSVGG